MTDLATVAANLRAIEDMALRLEARAVDRANDDLLGGEAMVNLASVGSMTDWQRRVDLREQAWLDNPDLDDADMPSWSEFEDPDELWPAVQVLWFWSEDYRVRLGMDYDDPRWRPTLLSEAKFLRNHDVAEWIWNNEVHWDDYAKDVERAKVKLESVLHEGERSERTPVVCDRCEDKRPLVRKYAAAKRVGWMCEYAEPGDERMPVDAGDEACPICEKPAPHVELLESDSEDDRWKCMGCKHEFDQAELADALATQQRRSDPREWVPRTEAIGLLVDMGHQRRTAASLADVPEADGWRDEVTHVRFVSWPDVWRAHLLALHHAELRRKNAERAAEHKAMCEKTHAEDCWIPGRGCSIVCPRGSDCEWFLCPVHAEPRRVSA